MPVIAGIRGPTAICTVRLLVASWTDVAVSVTTVLDATVGAVNVAVPPDVTVAAESVPALAVRVMLGL
jgi:hypothetical protein